MESPENRPNRNLAIFPQGMSVAISWQKNDLGGFRNPRSQTQVRAPLIVVSDPLCQDPAQLFLTQWNYEIQAFAAHCPYQSFTISIRFRSVRRRAQHFQP